jgi:phosphoribosyl-ATP pyrophosphohydrolase
MQDILDKLDKILQDRKYSNSDDSYIAALYEKGNNHICDKVMEEARELVEATRESENRIIHESADLLFHVLVLLASHDIKYARILEELENRFGTSGIEEKNNRK